MCLENLLKGPAPSFVVSWTPTSCPSSYLICTFEKSIFDRFPSTLHSCKNLLRYHWHCLFEFLLHNSIFCCGVVVITTAQLHPTKPELSFCAGSNPACSMSEIWDGEDLWQWSQLEIRLNAFCQSTIPQKLSSSTSSSTYFQVFLLGGIWMGLAGFTDTTKSQASILCCVMHSSLQITFVYLMYFSCALLTRMKSLCVWLLLDEKVLIACLYSCERKYW